MHLYIYIYIPIILALTFPKIRNLFQNFSPADMAIFSIDASSNKLENESPFTNPGYPIIPRAIVLSTNGRLAGNIMWSHKVFRSLSEFISLVTNDPELIYFRIGLVIGFSMTGGKVSTSRDVNRYHESPRRYMASASEL